MEESGLIMIMDLNLGYPGSRIHPGRKRPFFFDPLTERFP